MQSGSYENSTVQQNYTRGPNETAFLADIHLCCLIEIDSYSNRSYTAHHWMRAQGEQARSSITAVKNQGRRKSWRHGGSGHQQRGQSGSALWIRDGQPVEGGKQA